MSGYTMTQPELFYSFSGAGTALATFTTEASLMGGYPIPQIPATFFGKLGEQSSAMKIRAYGNMGDTTVAPTFTWTVRLLSSATTFSNTGTPSWATAATTVTGTSITNAWWQLDMDVQLRSIAAGAATSVLAGFGMVSGSMLSAPATIPAANTTAVVNSSNFDNTGATLYYLWLGAACGTSNAANAISLQGLKIYLEN